MARPYRVEEPDDDVWATAIERVTQDAPPCVVDDESGVVVIVLAGADPVSAGTRGTAHNRAGVRAQQIAAVLNGEGG